MVQIEVQPGEQVYGETGAMVFMTGNMNMVARVHGGVLSGIKRAVTGESFFVTEFTPNGGSGLVGFAGNVPGKIVPLDLHGGKVWICQKDSFLAAEDQVVLDVAFQKHIGSILFGGEGLFVTTLTGPGKVLLQSMTMQKLVGSIIPLLPKPQSGGEGHHLAALAPAPQHGGFHVTIGGGHH